MSKISKRQRQINELVKDAALQPHSVEAALAVLKQCPPIKFDPTLEVAVNLGVDPRQSDQAVRGAVVLPHGTGKTVRVAVFAEGERAEEAQAAGADVVGYEELAEAIKQGNLDFDVLIATPDAMRLVGQLGQILGPRGLMPNPKVGTVTQDVTKAVSDAKAGQVRYRVEKGGIIHCLLGKLSFEPGQVKDNLEALINALKKAKPASSKGVYFRKVTLSMTMGPGILIDLSGLKI